MPAHWTTATKPLAPLAPLARSASTRFAANATESSEQTSRATGTHRFAASGECAFSAAASFDADLSS